ncbi:hypothetical protein ScPMuIL_005620 [Solemya velum]
MKYSHIDKTLILLIFVSTSIRSFSTAKSVKLTQVLDENREKKFVQELKQEILKKLKYTKIPNVGRRNITVEERRRMIKIYKNRFERQEEKGAEDDTAQNLPLTFHTIRHDGQYPADVDEYVWLKEPTRLYFNVDLQQPSNPTEELFIKNAELKMYKKNVRPNNLLNKKNVDKEIRIDVYKIVELRDNGDYLRKLVDSRRVKLDSKGWETFHVTDAVKDWIEGSENNYGFELTSESQNITDVLDFELTNSPDTPQNSEVNVSDSKSPIIHIYSKNKPILKRIRRDSDIVKRDCTIEEGETRCCRYKWYISFKDIGWDQWVIAPEGYEGHYCAGSCPRWYKTANTFSNIKSILHLNNPDVIPPPCCVATELSPLTILHLNEENDWQFSEHKDMNVEDCKCA